MRFFSLGVAFLSLLMLADAPALFAQADHPAMDNLIAQRGGARVSVRADDGGILGLTTYSLSIASSESTTRPGGARVRVRAGIDRHPELAPFVTSNFQRIQKELAEGRGDRLDTIANLMGCAPSLQAPFGQWAQSRFEALLPWDNTHPTEFLDLLSNEAGSHPLFSSCRYRG